jgi:hypothetical protein
MNVQNRVRFLSLTVSLVLLILSAGRAAARDGSPIIFRLDLDDTFTTGYCGFPMEVHSTGTGVFHLFLDEAGNFQRLIITEPQIKMTFTNLTTGKSVWTPSVDMVEEVANDDGTGTKTVRGLLWRLVVPGQGLSTTDVGRIDFLFTFDDQGNIISEDVVFSAGQQNGQFEQMLCSVLSSAP